MQDLKGRRTIITEGNAKGSYVSYVIEEDVSTTKHLYVQRNTYMYNATSLCTTQHLYVQRPNVQLLSITII